MIWPFSRKPVRVRVIGIDDLAAAIRENGRDRIEAAKIVAGWTKPPAPPEPPAAPPDKDREKFIAWVERTAASPEERGDLVGKYEKATGKRKCSIEARARAEIELSSRGAPMPAMA